MKCELGTVRTWGGAFAALCVVGCASVPPHPTLAAAPLSFEVPTHWAEIERRIDSETPVERGAAAPDSALLSWWKRFDDPSLDALMRLALRQHTRIQGAQAAVREARALRDLAAAALFPTLDATATAQRASSAGLSTGSSFQVGLAANWLPDVFGAQRAAVAAGDAGLAAAEATLGDTQAQVAAELALDYILLRSTEARAALARRNLASQQDTLQIALWRQQAGLVSGLDVAQARAAALQTQALLPALQTSLSQTRHALAVLTGQPPAAPLSGLSELQPAPALALGQPNDGMGAVLRLPQAPDIDALGWPAQTLRQRADVRAAEAQVSAAQSRVDQAEAQRWPSLAMGGSLGLSALSLGALGTTSPVVNSLLASVSLPLVDGGSRRAQVRSQQALLDQAHASYEATVLLALQQVEDALAALRGDRLRVLGLRAAAEAAAEAAQLAQQRYQGGLIDFFAVLDTQRLLASTQELALSASADLSNDQVRLFTALGGGWLVPQASPTLR